MEAKRGARQRHTASRLSPAQSWEASSRRFDSIRRSISQYLRARGSGRPHPSSGPRKRGARGPRRRRTARAVQKAYTHKRATRTVRLNYAVPAARNPPPFYLGGAPGEINSPDTSDRSIRSPAPPMGSLDTPSCDGRGCHMHTPRAHTHTHSGPSGGETPPLYLAPHHGGSSLRRRTSCILCAVGPKPLVMMSATWPAAST